MGVKGVASHRKKCVLPDHPKPERCTRCHETHCPKCYFYKDRKCRHCRMTEDM
jgi:hypothetical protein